MNKRTIPAAVLGAVLAAGLLSACSASTGSGTPTATATATVAASSTPSPSATPSAVASPSASAAPSAPASQAPAPVALPSELTLTATAGSVSGHLLVAGSTKGVPDAVVSLVFRPTGGGDVQALSATTDASGAFTATAQGASAGTWTASFRGSDTAGSAAASAKVG